MPQRQISVVISLPMIVQLGKTLLLLKRSADYALGVVYHVKQQHFNPHPTSRPGATSWMILYPLIPLCFNPHPTSSTTVALRRRPNSLDSALDSDPCLPLPTILCATNAHLPWKTPWISKNLVLFSLLM